MSEEIEQPVEEPKPQKEKLSLNAKILLTCTILLIVFLSGASYVMFQYIDELTASPLTYGAQKVAEANGVNDLMCSCYLSGVTSPYKDPQFFFNTTTMWNERKTVPGKTYDPVNFSQLEGLFNGSSS